MVQITRKAEFSASHFLRNPGWSEEENREFYGPEAQTHGHNYVLEVTVAGEVDPVHGMILDLKELKELMAEQVVDPWDHRHLNHEAPPFDETVPTTENVAREIWARLAPRIERPGCRLHRVRLYETPDLFVDYSEGAAG